MKNSARVVMLLLFTLPTLLFAQTTQKKSVEDEKFVFLNNGTTVGMIIKSVLKADRQRLKLTDDQLFKAREIISNTVVKYNEGVKKMKATTGINSKKLRAFAVEVEDEKVRAYKAILTKEQYTVLLANHKKQYPESKAV